MFYDICRHSVYICAHATFDISSNTLRCFFVSASLDQVPFFPLKCCFMTFSFFLVSSWRLCTCNHHQAGSVFLFRSGAISKSWNFFFSLRRCVNIRWKMFLFSSCSFWIHFQRVQIFINLSARKTLTLYFRSLLQEFLLSWDTFWSFCLFCPSPFSSFFPSRQCLSLLIYKIKKIMYHQMEFSSRVLQKTVSEWLYKYEDKFTHPFHNGCLTIFWVAIERSISWRVVCFFSSSFVD